MCKGAQEFSLLPVFDFSLFLLQKSWLSRKRQYLAIAGDLSVGALVLAASAVLQVHTSSFRSKHEAILFFSQGKRNSTDQWIRAESLGIRTLGFTEISGI